jgi:hypothetical protein
MKSRAKYLALWRSNNRHSEWLHARTWAAKRLERMGGMVTILGVRVNWKVGAR